jgi:hypothetical protein
MPASASYGIVRALKKPVVQEEQPMEPIATPELDLDLDGERNVEELIVEEWRAEQLWRLGLPRALAHAFANLVDWHELAALVGHGCPPMLALEIVR